MVWYEATVSGPSTLLEVVPPVWFTICKVITGLSIVVLPGRHVGPDISISTTKARVDA